MIYTDIAKDDSFYSDVYMYFLRGGYWCIFVANTLNIVISAIILTFAIFTMFYLNWNMISQCKSETTCYDISSYIINPMSYHTTSMKSFMIILIIIVNMILII